MDEASRKSLRAGVDDWENSNRGPKAVLVYQGGIANVFEVDRFGEDPCGRHARRLLQHAFDPCAYFARGLRAAGWTLRTMTCNEAGDIIDRPWSYDLESAPWFEKFFIDW